MATKENSLPFDRIKCIDDETKMITFGYIRTIYTNQQIPEAVQCIVLLFYARHLDSEILTDAETKTLLDLFEKHDKFTELGNFYYDRIFHGLEDGFRAQTFVEKCHNHPNILVIIHTKDENVFGFYTSKGWEGELSPALKHAHDKKLFLFLIRSTNPKYKPLIASSRINGWRRGLASYHGYFCYLSDCLWLSNECNCKGYSKVTDCVKYYGLPTDSYLNADKPVFNVADLEVFQLKQICKIFTNNMKQ